MLFQPCCPVLTLAPKLQLELPTALAMILLSCEESVPASRGLHHHGRLTLVGGGYCAIVIVGEETPHTQQVEYLGGAFLVGGDEIAHHHFFASLTLGKSKSSARFMLLILPVNLIRQLTGMLLFD